MISTTATVNQLPKPVFPITADLCKSRGSYLYDQRQQRYFLDFFSMYSSTPLGYNHPIFAEEFYQKVQRIAHIKVANSVVDTEEFAAFQHAFAKYCFAPYIHYACTGSLAVEAALKSALEVKKSSNPLVLAVQNSFHGIGSWGTVTDRSDHSLERLRYVPKFPWLHQSLEELVTTLRDPPEDLAAVIIEPIQCTAGDRYLDQQTLSTLRKLCHKHEICFIVDEVQTGFGSTGTMWYSSQFNLDPDILIFGKKAQVSGIVAKEKYSECLTSADKKLVVTFDGDLLDMLRATYILKAYEQEDLVAQARDNEKFFREVLADHVLNFRATGHLIAFDFATQSRRDLFLRRCFAAGLLCNQAGALTVRLRPNLAVTADELSRFSDIMKQVLAVMG